MSPFVLRSDMPYIAKAFTRDAFPHFTMADHGRLQVYVILYQRNHYLANKNGSECPRKPIFIGIGRHLLRLACLIS